MLQSIFILALLILGGYMVGKDRVTESQSKWIHNRNKAIELGDLIFPAPTYPSFYCWTETGHEVVVEDDFIYLGERRGPLLYDPIEDNRNRATEAGKKSGKFCYSIGSPERYKPYEFLRHMEMLGYKAADQEGIMIRQDDGRAFIRIEDGADDNQKITIFYFDSRTTEKMPVDLYDDHEPYTWFSVEEECESHKKYYQTYFEELNKTIIP